MTVICDATTAIIIVLFSMRKYYNHYRLKYSYDIIFILHKLTHTPQPLSVERVSVICTHRFVYNKNSCVVSAIIRRRAVGRFVVSASPSQHTSLCWQQYYFVRSRIILPERFHCYVTRMMNVNVYLLVFGDLTRWTCRKCSSTHGTTIFIDHTTWFWTNSEQYFIDLMYYKF